MVELSSLTASLFCLLSRSSLKCNWITSIKGQSFGRFNKNTKLKYLHELRSIEICAKRYFLFVRYFFFWKSNWDMHIRETLLSGLNGLQLLFFPEFSYWFSDIWIIVWVLVRLTSIFFCVAGILYSSFTVKIWAVSLMCHRL